jgi:uncharacterized protein
MTIQLTKKFCNPYADAGGLELKAPGDDDNCYTLSGYASVFGNTDLDGDIIEKGAFTESLKGRTPLLLVNHNMSDLPVGSVVECREDQKGLYFVSKMPKDDSLVRDRLAPQLRNNSIKGVSIGFRTTESEPIKGGRGRRIKSAELWEISIVNVPANQLASVNSMKSVTFDGDILPISEKKSTWDADAALERVKSFTDCGSTPSDTYKSAFLFADEAALDDWSSYKFLIADVEGDCLKAQTAALFRASAQVMGHRDGDDLADDIKSAIRPVLDAYYDAMGLSSPFDNLSSKEFDALDASAREVRLRACGLTPGLAKSLSGSREGSRHRREGGSELHQDVKSLMDEVRQLTKGLSQNAGRKP